MNKRFAVLVGHRSKRKGAYSKHLKLSEFDFNKPIAEKLSDVADVFFRPNTSGVRESYRVKQALQPINRKNYDLVIELHFDSFGDPRANGCSALHFITNKKTKKLGDFFVEQVNSRIGMRKRSLIPIKSSKQRGGTFITYAKADAILLEPFFGSNKNDCEMMSNCIDEYINIIRDLFKMV